MSNKKIRSGLQTKPKSRRKKHKKTYEFKIKKGKGTTKDVEVHSEKLTSKRAKRVLRSGLKQVGWGLTLGDRSIQVTISGRKTKKSSSKKEIIVDKKVLDFKQGMSESLELFSILSPKNKEAIGHMSKFVDIWNGPNARIKKGNWADVVSFFKYAQNNKKFDKFVHLLMEKLEEDLGAFKGDLREMKKAKRKVGSKELQDKQKLVKRTENTYILFSAMTDAFYKLPNYKKLEATVNDLSLLNKRTLNSYSRVFDGLNNMAKNMEKVMSSDVETKTYWDKLSEFKDLSNA